jgi:RNA polymerase sigma-70 factor (ECF subfamily)
MDDTDEGLALRIRNGDHQAFSILVRRHTDRFYGLAWRLLGNSAEADDVVQDAFLKFWTQPDMFRPEAGARFTTWFYRVVSNLALDRLRGRKRWKGDVDFDAMPDRAATADAVYENRQMQGHLEAAIHELPERQKLALNLCFYEGMSVRDAAEVIGVGEKAVEIIADARESGAERTFYQEGAGRPGRGARCTTNKTRIKISISGCRCGTRRKPPMIWPTGSFIAPSARRNGHHAPSHPDCFRKWPDCSSCHARHSHWLYVW